ncbi:MAG: M1 family aminopeptidase, partial [Thermoanaerobaculales bacterium]|nr:M1 family aminopeptidase [Thermoanaerobaculales bacterium]
MVPRMVRAARLSVAWFGLFYGAYPYPQLTVVSPPVGAEEAGGMEYPNFITTGADRLDAYPPFSWSSDIEALTVHEFGHQYFQSLVASNEFEEAWLDEGVTSYAEISCMTAIAADGLVPEIAAFDYWGGERLSLALPRLPVTVGRKAWDYRHGRAYSLASYTKTALVLHTVEGLIGSESMARGMRSYFERFSFRHPTGSDLVEVLSETSGWDLGPFFDQAVFGDAVADWSVLSVRHRRPQPPDGFGWDGEGWSEVGEDESTDEVADDSWLVDLQLARRGDFIGPVDIELRWSDGTVERRIWDGETRWVRWRLEGSSRLAQVVIDPDRVWVIETRRADNYWRDQMAAIDHPLWWVREALRLAGHLFLRFS